MTNSPETKNAETKTPETQTPSTAPEATPAGLPLFYRSPMLLRAHEHAGFGLRRAAGAGFAAGAVAIPLVAGEFAAAGRHYPIVFASGEAAMPLVVTGVAAGRNLFVDAAGHWRAGTYVPGYVRRYPFIGMADQEGGPLMLGIDSTSDRLSTNARRDGADPFFEADGQPAEAGRAAIAFCEAYAVEHERTRAFAAALEANGLLVEKSLRIEYANPVSGAVSGTDTAPAAAAATAEVNGFRLVDEKAFRALSGEALATFHANGWLDLVALHLASQLSWQALVDASNPAHRAAA